MNGRGSMNENPKAEAAIVREGLPAEDAPAPRKLILVALILATAVIFAIANAGRAMSGADWLRLF